MVKVQELPREAKNSKYRDFTTIRPLFGFICNSPTFSRVSPSRSPNNSNVLIECDCIVSPNKDPPGMIPDDGIKALS